MYIPFFFSHNSFFTLHTLYLSCSVHLSLSHSQIRSRYPNEIIFGLNDGYYAADLDQKVTPHLMFVFIVNVVLRFSSEFSCVCVCVQENSERKKNSLLQVDQSSVRNSYSVFSLLRYGH